jgi:phenylalanyl-tRNA synthetase beta chain
VPSYYHPTKSASIKLGKNIIGYFGQLHPKIVKCYDLKLSCFTFEIFQEHFPQKKSKHGKKLPLVLSNYPTVTKDLAFVMDKSCQVGAIIADIEKLDKKLIKSVQLFDVYQGEKISSNSKSIAFTYSMQSDESTLNNEQIHDLMNKIIEFMMKKYNATLRRDM